MVEVACLSSPRSTACPAALRSMRYVPERSPGVEAGALEAVGFLGLHASGLWPASRLGHANDTHRYDVPYKPTQAHLFAFT